MQLIVYPDPILFERCKEVPNSGAGQSPKERASLAAAMWKIMDKNRGVGLAAPQVGLNMRMFVWKQYEANFAIWNPIVGGVFGISESIEGCLSLPGITVTKERSTISQIFGTDIDGKPCNYNGLEFQTRIWRHEIDHLNGQLIIDNMSHEDSVANRDALKKLLKEHCSLTR